MNHVDLEDKFTLFKGSLLDSSFTFSRYGINNGDNIAILDSSSDSYEKIAGSFLGCSQASKTSRILSSLSCQKDANRLRKGLPGVSGDPPKKGIIGVTIANFSIIYDSIFGINKNSYNNDILSRTHENSNGLSDGKGLPEFWGTRSGGTRWSH